MNDELVPRGVLKNPCVHRVGPAKSRTYTMLRFSVSVTLCGPASIHHCFNTPQTGGQLIIEIVVRNTRSVPRLSFYQVFMVS